MGMPKETVSPPTSGCAKRYACSWKSGRSSASRAIVPLSAKAPARVLEDAVRFRG
jgi:hypothetical protein